MRRVLVLGCMCIVAFAQQEPEAIDRDWTVRDFAFHTGEKLPELTLHYRTMGTPQRDAGGHVRNAVLVLHATSSSGALFLSGGFLGTLFLPGQPLDAAKYYVILPD